jgi:hypothetical protein
MIATQSFTLSTTPSTIATGVAEGKTVILRDASADIFLGGSSAVTSLTGLRLATTDVLSVTLYQGDVLFAVASTGTPTVRVLATRANSPTVVA